MRRTIQTSVAFAIAAALTVTGCTPVGLPTSADDGESPFFTTPPAPGFGAMRRALPLTSDEVVTMRIGADGGRIDLPRAGASFVVPAGALDAETEITMRALAGEVIAFEFAPHGLTFRLPASVHVHAAGTEAEPLLTDPARTLLQGRPLDGYLGVYFEGDPASGVEPLETIETRLEGDHLVYDVEHFSGYVSASG